MGDEPHDEFWREFGIFMLCFTIAEQRLIQLLRKVSGVSAKVAGVIFSGTRTDQAKAYINKILDEQDKLLMKKRLERPFAQLSVINTIRNNLVHWGTKTTDYSGDLTISNVWLSPAKDKIKSYKLNAKNLKEMQLDLFLIHLHLVFEINDGLKSSGPFDAIVAQSWQYTPPQPSLRTKRLRPIHTERKHQPHA